MFGGTPSERVVGDRLVVGVIPLIRGVVLGPFEFLLRIQLLSHLQAMNKESRKGNVRRGILTILMPRSHTLKNSDEPTKIQKKNF